MLGRSEMQAAETGQQLGLLIVALACSDHGRAVFGSRELRPMRTDSQSNGLAERGRVLLRRAAVVTVVQTADLWNGDDAAERWWRDRPGVR